MKIKRFNKNQRGAALFEFAIVATVFLSVMFGVIEFGRLFWTHNALRDAARRGVRYATLRDNDAAGTLAVKKMVVYGDPNADTATATPVVSGLTVNDVDVQYANYQGIQLSSKATVAIKNASNQTYQFHFSVPLLGGTFSMPSYQTSLPGESAGKVPCDGGGLSACLIIPD